MKVWSSQLCLRSTAMITPSLHFYVRTSHNIKKLNSSHMEAEAVFFLLVVSSWDWDSCALVDKSIAKNVDININLESSLPSTKQFSISTRYVYFEKKGKNFLALTLVIRRVRRRRNMFDEFLFSTSKYPCSMTSYIFIHAIGSWTFEPLAWQTLMPKDKVDFNLWQPVLKN